MIRRRVDTLLAVSSKKDWNMPRDRRDSQLTLECLLNDEQLEPVAARIDVGELLADGVEQEDLDHPQYGRELLLSICLEKSRDEFLAMGLSPMEHELNEWYRCERFARLYDEVHDDYFDGNHHRADRLSDNVAVNLSNEELTEVDDRIDREVQNILGN